LEAIKSLQRHDRTIVLLPVSPPVESLDDSALVADFPRAIHADEMDWKAPLDHFAFRELLVRAANIANLPAAERLALVRGGQLDATVPIASGDLFCGFETLASAQQKANRPDRVAFCYSRLTVIARQSGDGHFLARYLTQWAQARWLVGDFRGSLANVLEGEQTLGRLEASSPAPAGTVLTASALRERKKQMVLNPSQAFLENNQTQELFNFLTEVLEPVRQWNDLELEALCLSKWAEGEIRAARIDEAQKTIDRVLELAGRTGDRFREAFAIHLRGITLATAGDESGAVSAYQSALNRLPRPGVYEIEWAIFMNLGHIAERRGDLDGARTLYAAAEACADALGHARQRTTAADARNRLESS
jgi:tetratricopeptide (TPR) repeat protein